MKKDNKAIVFALTSITQLGISVVVSFLLWILIAMWVKNTFHTGNGVMVAGVILGAGSSILSFIKYIQKIAERGKHNEE